MSNWSKESILKFISQHGYKAPIGDALSIASDFESLKNQVFALEEVLIILSESVIGMSKQGVLPESLKNKDIRPAIKWALLQVSRCHAGVRCGFGGDDSMENVMKRIEEDIQKGRKYVQ